MRRWLYASSILAAVCVLVFFVVIFPLAGSFLITSSRARLPERGTRTPASVGLPVETVEFVSNDSLTLRGWWTSSGDAASDSIVFVHGWNRSRLEMLERAAEAHRKGYQTLLFDLRNHGESDDALTTLGIDESRDVCAAIDFVRHRAPQGKVALWGVSLGASTALLAASRCGEADAVISDSSFLSFEETVAHHFNLIFRLPSFPVADLLMLVTRWRTGLDLADGDVERAVSDLSDTPILFIAGGADRRMPPELAQRLHAASRHPARELLIVDGAAHGRAFQQAPEIYLETAFGFLDHALGNVSD